MVSKVDQHDEGRTKGGMTLYYMSINVGSLLATIISLSLLHSKYGPLSIFAVVFIGKSIAALNFAWRYKLYDDVIESLDKVKMRSKQWIKLLSYIFGIYLFTFFAYLNPQISSYIIGIGCVGGISAFLLRTMALKGEARTMQLLACVLIIVAIIFFVMYNQMNTTLVLFAKSNSDLKLFGLTVSPANYQMVNPISILLLGSMLPKFYSSFKRFTIPYQFAAGIIIAGLGMLVMWYACTQAQNGLINGNYLVLGYFVITISELFVSALGLSMIGLYCEQSMVAFAMGAFYLAMSLSNIITGQLGKIVALPKGHVDPLVSLSSYQNYYQDIGLMAIVIGIMLTFGAILLHKSMARRGIRMT